MEISKLDNLLKLTNVILEKQKEVAKIKGEDFNIFSILGMESKEVKTHSRFIAELLNPKGRHNKGTKFLKLFLNQISYLGENNKEKYINLEKTEVITEKYIGKKTNLTGGRIDILIKNVNDGNGIAIENKIFADDKDSQLLRYYNFQKKDNKLYYLTLLGSEPDEKSVKVNSNDIENNNLKNEIKKGEDFFLLSYRDDILPWLEKCYKETTSQPILRETIKQYIILIKKLTKILDMEKQNELNNLMLSNLEASEFIANNYYNTLNKIKENFRDDILTKLINKFNGFEIKNETNVDKIHSKIWIYKEPFKFGIESFSGNGFNFDNKNLFVGLFKPDKNKLICNNDDFKNNIENKYKDYWPYIKWLEYENDKYINMRDNKFIKKLYLLKNDEPKEYSKMIDFIVEQVDDFIKSFKSE